LFAFCCGGLDLLAAQHSNHLGHQLSAARTTWQHTPLQDTSQQAECFDEISAREPGARRSSSRMGVMPPQGALRRQQITAQCASAVSKPATNKRAMPALSTSLLQACYMAGLGRQRDRGELREVSRQQSTGKLYRQRVRLAPRNAAAMAGQRRNSATRARRDAATPASLGSASLNPDNTLLFRALRWQRCRIGRIGVHMQGCSLRGRTLHARCAGGPCMLVAREDT